MTLRCPVCGKRFIARWTKDELNIWCDSCALEVNLADVLPFPVRKQA